MKHLQKFKVSLNKKWATLFSQNQNDQILTITTLIIYEKKNNTETGNIFILQSVFGVSHPQHFCPPVLCLCLPYNGLKAQRGSRQSGKANLLSRLVLYILSAHFVELNRCHWISKYRRFDYFQMFSYLNRGHINIHDRKHILSLVEKTLKTSVHRPTWKCRWKQVIPVIYYLSIYLFIFTFTMIILYFKRRLK